MQRHRNKGREPSSWQPQGQVTEGHTENSPHLSVRAAPCFNSASAEGYWLKLNCNPSVRGGLKPL